VERVFQKYVNSDILSSEKLLWKYQFDFLSEKLKIEPGKSVLFIER